MTPHMIDFVRDFVGKESGPVLEIGSYIEAQQEHLNVRHIFTHGVQYTGVDLNAGSGVDYVVDFLDPERMDQVLQVSGGAPRVTLCLYVLEHVWDIRAAAEALARIWQRNPESWLIVSTHQNQPQHGTPMYGDYWRLTLPGLALLMDKAGVPETRIFGLCNTSNPEDVVAVRHPLSSPWPERAAALQAAYWKQWR